MFLTFSMPRLSPKYAGVLPLALPYIVPVLQTSLTVSVYMTVAIAITALLYIIKPVTLDQPSPTSPDQQEGNTVPIDRILSVKNARVWVSMDFT